MYKSVKTDTLLKYLKKRLSFLVKTNIFIFEVTCLLGCYCIIKAIQSPNDEGSKDL